jgi:hypothetical protein
MVWGYEEEGCSSEVFLKILKNVRTPMHQNDAWRVSAETL